MIEPQSLQDLVHSLTKENGALKFRLNSLVSGNADLTLENAKLKSELKDCIVMRDKMSDGARSECVD